MSYLPYACGCALCAGRQSKMSTDDSSQAAGVAPPLTQPPATPVIANPITGDYRIDGLLDNANFRWNKDAPMGSAVTVSYSFMSGKPTYGGTDSGGDTGFTPFNDEQIAATRQILTKMETELGIRFTEVSDSTTSYGQIRLGNNTQADSGGYAYLPNSTGDDKAGDVWMNQAIAANTTNLVPGTSGYLTLVHELGHAVGLKHPGNYNAGEPASTAPGNFLGVVEDNLNYSIMSYRDASGGQLREWFGAYDLLALRKLYGGGTPAAGNSTYSATDNLGTVLSLINDASGIDTIDASRCTSGVVIDLNPGKFSSVGASSTGLATNNLSIDLSTTVENVIGTVQTDRVVGNSANNTFALGLGSNISDGGAGIDMQVYDTASSAMRITVSGTNLKVDGTSIADSLSNIERLSFTDKKLAFDIAGNAGTTAKILGAVFGKEAVANQVYAAIGLQLLDGGMSYVDLMQAALNAKLGVGVSNATVVSLLYQNLLGVLPGEPEIAFYSGLITAGAHTQATLGVLAADTTFNTTNIGLTGLATTGLAYA